MAKTAALPPADKIFAGKVFVLQGDFGRYPRTHLNIARLIARHGGRVDNMVTDRTTLLVTTIEEFRKRTPPSKFAFISVSLLLSDPSDIRLFQSRRQSHWERRDAESFNGNMLKILFSQRMGNQELSRRIFMKFKVC